MRGSSPVVGPRRRLFRSLLPLLCFAGLGPRAAMAQEPDGPSILALLPVDGAPLRIGEERSGTLGEQDYRTTNDVTVRAFELAGAKGQPISVDLISEAFDAYLFLLGPDGSELASDDDSGGACHARLSQFLPVDGSYRLVVGALSGSGGAFTLRVGDRQAPAVPGDCSGSGDFEGAAFMRGLEPLGSLEPGSEVTGTLTSTDPTLPEGTAVQAWLLTGPSGRTLVVDLVSERFDAFLYVVPPGGSYWMDDDSGGACHSRIEVTLEGDEPYRVVVNTVSGTGAYTLRVGEAAAPAAPGPCEPPADLDPMR